MKSHSNISSSNFDITKVNKIRHTQYTELQTHEVGVLFDCSKKYIYKVGVSSVKSFTFYFNLDLS